MIVTTLIPDGAEHWTSETLALRLVASRNEQDFDLVVPGAVIVDAYLGEAQGITEDGRRVWIPAVWGVDTSTVYGVTCRYQD